MIVMYLVVNSIKSKRVKLRIYDAQLTDNGNYTLKAHSQNMNTSTTMKLVVLGEFLCNTCLLPARHVIKYMYMYLVMFEIQQTLCLHNTIVSHKTILDKNINFNKFIL